MKQLLARHLFRTDSDETTGQYLHFKLLELIIVIQTIQLAIKWAEYMPRLGTVVLPLGIANYIDVSFMFTPPWAMVNAILMILFSLWGLFGKNRYAYLIAFLLFHLHYVARFSQGEISHGSNFTGMAMLVLGLASFYFRDQPEQQRKFAFGMVLFFIGLGYTSASLCKLVATGPGWVDGAHLWMWIGERATDVLSQHGAFALNELQLMALEHKFIATIILSIGLFTEFVGIGLWFRPTRPIVVTLLIGMHFGIAWSMNITFTYFMYILPVIGYPLYKIFDFLLDQKQIRRLTVRLKQQRFK